MNSLNARAEEMVCHLVADADDLRIAVKEQENGAQIIDAGIDVPGSIEAGLRICDICLAGLARTTLIVDGSLPMWPFAIQVTTCRPVEACLGSQYAGWSAEVSQGDRRYRAMLSGPGRILARAESIFEEIAVRDSHDAAVLVLENDELPPVELTDHLATRCGVDPSRLRIIVTPTGSLAGGIQISARVVEVAIHRAHDLGFDLTRILDTIGVAPLPTPTGNYQNAMGRTNDVTLLSGRVWMNVNGDEGDARTLAEQLTSTGSSMHGRPFRDIFEDSGQDFYQIDPGLFSPAEVWVTAMESGKTFHAGYRSPEILVATLEIG